MSTALPAATDYLYTLAQQAVDGVTVNGKPAIAVDGWPTKSEPGMFVVGMELPPPDIGSSATQVQRQWYGVGGKRLEEDFTVPCFIDIRVDGKVQKPARDAAAAIWNTFWTALALDLTLGGILHTGRIAAVDTLTWTPEQIGTAADPGRRQLITFGVNCRNLTT